MGSFVQGTKPGFVPTRSLPIAPARVFPLLASKGIYHHWTYVRIFVQGAKMEVCALGEHGNSEGFRRPFRVHFAGLLKRDPCCLAICNMVFIERYTHMFVLDLFLSGLLKRYMLLF